MTEAEPIELDRLKPLVNYFEALVEVYPKPMTQTDLAKRIERTKTAVNKVKKRLFHFCDKDLLAYQSKMILKLDWNTFGSLLILFLMTKGGAAARKFLESRYGTKMLQRLYTEMCESKEIGRYISDFSEDEFFYGVRTIGYNLEQRQPQWQPLERLINKIDEPQLKSDFYGLILGREMQLVIKNLRPLIETKEDVIYALGLIEKVYHISKTLIFELIEKLDIMESLKNSEEKDRYREVYHKTIEFYLDHFFTSWIEYVQQEVEESNLPVEVVIRSDENIPGTENDD